MCRAMGLPFVPRGTLVLVCPPASEVVSREST
jgi:hypothetical protein